MSIAAVVASGCCCDCCSVLAGAPDYIDVELSFTHTETARICNPGPGSAWVEGDIVVETSISGSLKTRLKKVQVEGCWTYECPPEEDPNQIHSVSFLKSETHYLACYDIFATYWYGETYNEVWTYALEDQPGCIAFSVTLNTVPGEGCELCVTLSKTSETGVTLDWECGECSSPGTDSGTEETGLPVAGGALVLTACRTFTNAAELIGAMTSCENPFDLECPCPQTTCSGSCFFEDYPGAIKTCMSIAAHDVTICNSSSCSGSIEAVP